MRHRPLSPLLLPCSAAVVIGVLGCAPAPSTSPFLVDDRPAAPPALDAQAVGRALVDAVPAVVLAPPGALMALYQELAPDGAACAEDLYTESSATDVVESWLTDGCTLDNGTTLAGTADVIQRFTDRPRDDDGALETGYSIEGGDGFTVRGGDGRSLRVAGSLSVARAVGEGFTESSVSWDGTLVVEGVDGVPAFLRGEVGGTLELYARVDADGTKTLDVEGAVSGAPLAPATALSFAAFHVESSAGACSREPSGAASVRDDAGVWSDVAFDAEGDGEGCDGCGALARNGAPDGSACVDAALVEALLAWEVSPW